MHPAHPLHGQWVTVRSVQREGQTHYLLVEWPDNGQVRRIPQDWTDQAILAPATPGARFTPQQLRSVRQWLDTHLPVALDGEVGRVSLEEKLTTSGGDPHAPEASSDSAADPLGNANPASTAATPGAAGEVDVALLESPTGRESQFSSANRRVP